MGLGRITNFISNRAQHKAIAIKNVYQFRNNIETIIYYYKGININC